MNLTRLGPDLTLATQNPTTYYADFTTPARLGTVTVLVQVPQTTVSGVAALRETANAPRYGLPGDLNFDAVIDANARDTNRNVLPVVVRLRWQRTGRAAQEVVVPAWLRRAS